MIHFRQQSIVAPHAMVGLIHMGSIGWVSCQHLFLVSQSHLHSIETARAHHEAWKKCLERINPVATRKACIDIDVHIPVIIFHILNDCSVSLLGCWGRG